VSAGFDIHEFGPAGQRGTRTKTIGFAVFFSVRYRSRPM